ncbi:transposable element Tc1 transposase [Trichonephila clavipes]|uniref:Transposable element Tc1 transposase n=1 Tax=Trichonephila clavipes TaxID=2585209 RepID=A0A8X6RTT3_TRICX|nr:transposable element Tc1 transposase [Trichonephila clavipes]
MHASSSTNLLELTSQRALLDMGIQSYKQDIGGGIMLQKTFSRVTLGPLVLVEDIMNLLESLCMLVDQLHPYMLSVLSTENGIFQQDNVPCEKAILVSEFFEEHKHEFYLMFWTPKSADIYLIKHIVVFTERKKAQKSSYQNISTLCDH